MSKGNQQHENSEAGFDLYFENLEKTIIPGHSTKTVSWQVTDDQYVELWRAGSPNEDENTKFSKNALSNFYDAILSEFKTTQSILTEDNFPRGAQIEGDKLASFFLNLDCNFEIENSHSLKNEELHLEFVYEFSGSKGLFPRWFLGKNVGGGWGNGFGNGA